MYSSWNISDWASDSSTMRRTCSRYSGLSSAGLSGTHARVSRREGRYFLADLNSSNGSFLRIRGERAIRTGSFLLLGQQLFRVQFV